jgi:hypothetical protein
MTADRKQSHPDVQSLTDVDTYVYETVATLEYTGRPVTREQLAATADLDGDALDATLSTLVGKGLLIEADTDDGTPGFEPAKRGWSAAPEQGQGM